MTEQHPSSKLPITRERYDEMAAAGLSNGQITQVVAAGVVALSESVWRLATSAAVAAFHVSGLGNPPIERNSRGITYTNRAARRQQSRKGRP